MKQTPLHDGPAPRDEAITAMSLWYWLMRDIASGRAYPQAEFDMGTFVTYWPTKHRGQYGRAMDGLLVDDWCGTAACAAGFAGIAGVFPVAIKLTAKGTVTSPLDWDDVGRWLGLTGDDWSSIVAGDYAHAWRGDRAKGAREVADRIAGKLWRRYRVRVQRVALADRPWIGKRKALRLPARRRAA